MIYAPDYYPHFRCIAADCRHSCCIGWEIDIDADTRAAYAAVGGEIGEKLTCAIDDSGDAPHFRLTPDERCPFLRRDGLCELILTLGEDSLCQICADHPRFRSFWSGRTELGLGLCCEAAGALILSRSEPMRLIPIEDDGDDTPPDDDERVLLTLRDELLAIAGDTSLPLDGRFDAILARAGSRLPERTMADWRQTYLTLERLDPAWDDALAALNNCTPHPGWDEPFARLLEYFLYRHLPAALDDGRTAERAAFAVLSVHVIRTLFAAGEPTMARLVELARMYSSEIEYDEDNVEALLGKLT
ncbi:MAG: flagellin lysine-N-methylase [Clostridia bacterium]|nr:flagellin lysine-N-methylase [Clostridia bacterium]